MLLFLFLMGCGGTTGHKDTIFGSEPSSTTPTTPTVDPVAISPTSYTLVINENTTFTATDGTEPYTFSVSAGTGSINASTGVYTAPAAPGTATITVTDGDGNTDTASVTINAELAISPATLSITQANTPTFTATGGVAPYTYSVTAGNATINATTGVLTPTGTGAVTVRVTDSGARTSDATVTIFATLSLTPDAPSMPINDTETFVGSGGVPPLVYSVQSGGGSIDSGTGLYTAPGVAGSAVVRVTDAYGNYSEETVTITGPLSLSPATITIAVNIQTTLTATGGTAPYTFSIQSGDGSVDASTGVYTAPATPTVAVVRVTDNLGATDDSTVTVVADLGISPSSITLAVFTNFTFTTTGTTSSNLTYSVAAGTGSINATTGVYTAPSAVGSDTVEVTDDSLQVASATVTVVKPTKIVSGDNHSCALYSDGGVKCWGDNAYGQLGKGNTADLGDGANEMGGNLTFVNLGTGETATDISAGGSHTCVILADGDVKCWGYNIYGQLGLGHANNIGDGAGEMGDSLPVVDLGTGRTAAQIATGTFATCAILDNSDLKCWGYNGRGGLGLGNTAHRGDGAGEMGDSLPAINLGTGRTAVEVAVSGESTCAILDDSSLKCWGGNTYGQLGQGNVDHLGNGPGEMGDALPTVDLGTGRTASKIRAAVHHLCAILDNGSVKCWGRNQYGQLGLGHANTIGDGAGEMGDSLPAVSMGTGLTATELSTGYSVCVILSDTTTKCWGRNTAGQLGIGNTAARGDNAGEMGDTLPTVNLGTGVLAVQVASTLATSCALLDNDRVKCWGAGLNGGLGSGNTNNLGDSALELGDNLPFLQM